MEKEIVLKNMTRQEAIKAATAMYQLGDELMKFVKESQPKKIYKLKRYYPSILDKEDFREIACKIVLSYGSKFRPFTCDEESQTILYLYKDLFGGTLPHIIYRKGDKKVYQFFDTCKSGFVLGYQGHSALFVPFKEALSYCLASNDLPLGWTSDINQDPILSPIDQTKLVKEI